MGIKFLIDPGHGGNETGAEYNGYIEKDLNLKLSLLLKEELERCLFTVLMTRTSDTEVNLEWRGQYALKNQCTCLISLHFNAMGNPNTGKGFEAIYSIGNESAKWIALSVMREVEKIGVSTERGVWTKESSYYPGHNYYGVLRSAEPIPGVILEGLFLDNDNDIKFLQDPTFLKKLAVAYAKGICQAYGYPYIAEQPKQVVASASFENLSWEEIIDHVSTGPDKWKKGITAAVNAAKSDGSLGDLEVFEWLPGLIKKVYEFGSGNKVK